MSKLDLEKPKISGMEDLVMGRMEADMVEEFQVFNKTVKRFLSRAHGKNHGNSLYINQRLTEIELQKNSIIEAWHSKIRETIYNRADRKALRFRLRTFYAMHRLYMSKDSEVGKIYADRYNKSEGNQANINNILDTQYISWAMLREPQTDVVGQLRRTIERVYSDPRPAGRGDVEPYFVAFENGIIAHAGVHALFAERGYYVSAPPDPVLDAEYGIDLIAIRQGDFVSEVQKLSLNKDEESRLLEDVGTYQTNNGGSWIDTVKEYPSLVNLVTLIQVKSHGKEALGGSNVIVNGGYLPDTMEVTSEMLDNIPNVWKLAISRQVSGEVVSGTSARHGGDTVKIPSSVITDAVFDFTQMARVLPGANLSFVNMNINSARIMISRRA